LFLEKFIHILGLLFLITCALRMRKQPFKEEPASVETASSSSSSEAASKKGKKTGGGKRRKESPRGGGIGREEVSIARSTPIRSASNDDPHFSIDVTPIVGADCTPEVASSVGGSAAEKKKNVSSAEKSSSSAAKKSRGKSSSSRRALFRHRKLENLVSDEDDDDDVHRDVDIDDDDMTEGDVTSFPTSLVVASPERMMPRKQTPKLKKLPESLSASSSSSSASSSRQRETPSRRSARKGGDASSSVQYNRMRNQSEVEIDLTDCAGLNDFRV